MPASGRTVRPFRSAVTDPVTARVTVPVTTSRRVTPTSLRPAASVPDSCSEMCSVIRLDGTMTWFVS